MNTPYYPNKTVCPCVITTDTGYRLSKYIGLIMPWDNDTAYDSKLIERCVARFPDISFILFFDKIANCMNHYKFMSTHQNLNSLQFDMMYIFGSENSQIPNKSFSASYLMINDKPTLDLIIQEDILKRGLSLLTPTGIIDNKVDCAHISNIVNYNRKDLFGIRTLRDIELSFSTCVVEYQDLSQPDRYTRHIRDIYNN